MQKPIDLDTIVLAKGAHDPNGVVCVMELASQLADEPWSDHPSCVSPVIGAFLRSWNDALDDGPRQMLKPYALKAIGTNTGPNDDNTRAWMVTDWLVRVQAPAWLSVAGLTEQATALRAIPTLTSSEIAMGVQSVLDEARRDAGAARAAAWDAAWDAAGAAAWDAARDAAGVAAGAAAWAAARAAAGVAAWAAAGDAAGDAARVAAGAKLQPTVLELQQSALGLLDQMIAVGKP